MIYISIIVGLSCAALITLVLVKPSVKILKAEISIYWLAPLIGAGLILAFGLLTFKDAMAGLASDSEINPLKILVLFISMTVLSIFLDEAGFFSFLANFVLKKSKTSQKALFIYLYLIVSVLTVFTSNDIIVLTFTPFICYFAKNARINPLPFLLTEFVAANTWSMLLIIGNPTNIYLATAAGLKFAEYFLIMILPTLFAGITSFFILYLLFKKQLNQPIDPVIEEIKIKDKGMLIIGLIHLGACTVLLIISSYINLEMWFISFVFLLSLFLISLIYSIFRKKQPKELLLCLKRAPWELIPFVISMFILVLVLKSSGITQILAEFLGENNSILTYGLSSFLCANLINNIPMSVLYSAISTTAPAVYASIIGSNIGAFLTPIGALAGIMWTGILKKHEVRFSFLSFIKYGAIISIPAILASLGGLYLSQLMFVF